MPKFAANLGFLWTELPLLDRIAAAGRAGFRAVELHYPYDLPPADVAKACRDANVVLLGVNTALGPGPNDRGLAAVPGRRDEARALVDQSVDFIREAGGTSVHVMAGLVPREQHAEGRVCLLDTLRYAIDRIGDDNITVLLEALNPRDMPGYFYTGLEDMASVVAELDNPHVRMMFDTYHIGVAQGDIITRLRTHFPLVGHVQIAAVPSRAEPDEGEIAYPAIFAELEALGYAGWIGCEYRPRAGTEIGLRWVEALGVSL